MTGTHFSAGQCATKDDPGSRQKQSEIEQLEEACWNGLLPEMLPEIMVHPQEDAPIYLWEVRQSNTCIELEFGELPVSLDNQYSIAPQSFLPYLIQS